MKSKWLVLSLLAVAFTVAPWSLRALNPQPFAIGSADDTGADDASLYADGTRAINESRWQDAVGLFDKVAQMRGEHAEGALY